MGFPAGYTEVLLPKLLINTLSFFGLLRRLILTLLRVMGLPEFLDPDVDWSTRPDPVSLEAGSVSATLIREMLPVAVFSDIIAGENPDDLPENCAVCLYEFEERDEIRRMRNCPHMFHRSCVDRWIDHDRKTCPLCRTPFVPEELQEDFNERLWAASGIPEFYSDYAPITNF